MPTDYPLVSFVQRSFRLTEIDDGFISPVISAAGKPDQYHFFWDDVDKLKSADLRTEVPPPRFNLVRYHGIVAPSARWRSRIVPVESQNGDDLRSCPGCSEGKKGGQADRHESPGKIHPRNYTWSELMKRVFDQSINCMSP
jgi:hypothetical protein